MTNKSAIVIIKAMITTHKSLEAQGINSDVPFDEESIEALNVAIDSLKKPNIHGHWIAFSGGYLCSKCRKNNKGVVRVKMVAHKYCPDCGAIMDEVKPKGEKGTE